MIGNIIDSEVWDEFSARLDEMHWRETDDGVLLAAESTTPDIVAVFKLTRGGMEGKLDDPEKVNWREAEPVARPTTESNPQFD